MATSTHASGPTLSTHDRAAADKERAAAASKVLVAPALKKEGQQPAFLAFLEQLHSAWQAPRVTITYKDLSIVFPTPLRATPKVDADGHASVAVPNIISTLIHWATLPVHHVAHNLGLAKDPSLYALNHVSGVIHPGTMTLVLSPPGHGKSSLLKVLSGRVDTSQIRGNIHFNGHTMAELKQAGVELPRLASYVGQLDMHFPSLTVRETLKFAADSSVTDAGLLASAGCPDVSHLVELEKTRGDMLVDLIGLTECADVIVGSEMMRGVSGGQKKRVTLGEMMVGNARLLALDEVSTGLDAAVTASIFGSLKEMTRITGSSVVTALLQPTPETYHLFDQVILLHEGRVVYHGPRADIKLWLWQVCGLDVPVDVDETSFLVDFLCDPALAVETARLLAQAGSFAESTREMRQADKQAEEAAKAVNETSIVRAPPAGNPVDHPELYGRYKTFTQAAGEPDSEPSAVIFHTGEEIGEGGEVAFARAAALVPHVGRGETVNCDDSASSCSPDAPNVPTPRPVNDETRAKRFGRGGIAHSTAGVPPVRDMAEVRERYAASRWHSPVADVELHRDAATKLDPTTWSEYTRASFARPNPHSYQKHLELCFSRQFKLFKRNRSVLVPRMAKSISIGLFFGLLFFRLAEDAFQEKLAICMYGAVYAALTNLSESPVAADARTVISKQLTAGFYPSSPYYFGVLTTHIPLTVVESVCYGTLLYWIAGMEADAGRYFFYLLICTLASNAMATLYRFLAYIAPNLDVAKQLDFPFVVIFIILNAFIIVYTKVPVWLRYWAFWIAPLEWATKALSLNEFTGSTYDHPAPNNPSQRIGDYYLVTYELPTDHLWKWWGVLYLFGWYLVWSGVCIFFLRRQKLISPLGSERAHYDAVSREDATVYGSSNSRDRPARAAVHEIELQSVDAAPPTDEIALPMEALEAKAAARSGLSALPFVPVTLSWSHLEYSVTLPTDEERMLLRDVHGFGSPGEMTALMGASGAGKTTLMDVIAGRKTTGKITADIRLNGQPVDIRSAFFQQLCGYVEQFDLHIGTSTVIEALRFSAKLRLPTSVSQEQQHRFVEEVMELLGLTPFANSVIGDAAISGLAPAQLKLVTIGVELVANPSILFLDEPTSGLDAPAAWRVMTAIKRIALTGRNILCTIHQPAARLFFLFDRLLLLKPGGRTVYFHSIGRRGETLVSYFEAASNFTSKFEAGANPANWMLDVTSGTASKTDWSQLWNESPLNQEIVRPGITRAVDPATYTEAERMAATATVDDSAYPSWWVRYKAVQGRLLVSNYRNGPTNITRALVIFFIGLLIGLVYFHIRPSDFAGLNSMLAGLYISLIFGPTLPTLGSLPTLFRQRAVYYREGTVRMYDYRAYALSLTVAEFLSMAILVALYVLPVYFLMHLATNGNQFWRFYWIIFMLSQFQTSCAQFYLAYLPNQISASVVHAILTSFLFMFGGLTVTRKAMPAGWLWFNSMIPTSKGYIAIALSQLSCSDSAELSGGFGCGYITLPTSTVPVQVYQYVSSIMENSVDSYGNQVGWLFLQIAVVKLLTVIGFRFITHLKR